jgi:hypothetical protein
MLRHIRDELTGIGADFHFQKFVKLHGDTVHVKHVLNAQVNDDPKTVTVDDILELLNGGLVIESNSLALGTALVKLIDEFNPTIRFDVLDSNRPFIRYDEVHNELIIKAFNHEVASRYLGTDFFSITLSRK